MPGDTRDQTRRSPGIDQVPTQDVVERSPRNEGEGDEGRHHHGNNRRSRCSVSPTPTAADAASKNTTKPTTE